MQAIPWWHQVFLLYYSMVAGDEDVDLGLDCVGTLLDILGKFPEFDGTNPPTTQELEEATPNEAVKESKDEL